MASAACAMPAEEAAATSVMRHTACLNVIFSLLG
jgi:hypothetical protein